MWITFTHWAPSSAAETLLLSSCFQEKCDDHKLIFTAWRLHLVSYCKLSQWRVKYTHQTATQPKPSSRPAGCRRGGSLSFFNLLLSSGIAASGESRAKEVIYPRSRWHQTAFQTTFHLIIFLPSFHVEVMRAQLWKNSHKTAQTANDTWRWG